MNIHTSETEYLKTQVQRLSALVRAQQITIDKLEAQPTWVNATTWRGLTDEEIYKISNDLFYGNGPCDTIALCRAIEAKLKEKNT